jgi:hypothetical protein
MGKRIEHENIRIVLGLHQRVIFSCGISARSSLYCQLARRQKLLLSMFKLPATDETIRATITYPLTPPTSSLLCDALCRHPNGFMQYSEASQREELLVIMIMVEESSFFELQVDYIYDSLMRLVEQYKKL